MQRPDDFALASSAPLETVPAQDSLRFNAPDAQPVFHPAERPGPPLETLSPQRTHTRDPSQPFKVVESAATADTSAWSGAHSSSLIQAPAGVGWGPPSVAPGGTAAPNPTVPVFSARDANTPFHLSNQQPPMPPALSASLPAPGPVGPPAQFPEPGTVQWFAPPPPGQAPAGAPAPALSIGQALTWGYIVVLALSLVYVIAPATLVIGVILSGQVKLGRSTIRKLGRGALITLGVIAVLSIATGPATFGEWWGVVSIWAMLIALGLLLASFIVVLRERSRGGYPPPGSTWG